MKTTINAMRRVAMAITTISSTSVKPALFWDLLMTRLLGGGLKQSRGHGDTPESRAHRGGWIPDRLRRGNRVTGTSRLLAESRLGLRGVARAGAGEAGGQEI